MARLSPEDLFALAEKRNALARDLVRAWGWRLDETRDPGVVNACIAAAAAIVAIDGLNERELAIVEAARVYALERVKTFSRSHVKASSE